MSFVKKNGLNHFLNSIKKYNKHINQSKITEVVGEIGVDIAKAEYVGDSESSTDRDIRYEINGDNVEIIARGEKLAFSEFGTGVLGQGTYEGNLPSASMKLMFESPKGVQQSTDGWEYNYRAEQAKKKGVVLKDFRGRPAKAQMFNTSLRLQSELGGKILDYIRRG